MKILIVDDEEAICEIMSTMLSDNGDCVEATMNGADAFRIYCEAVSDGKPFDFVLTGLELPGMDGVALARSIWEKNPNQRLGFSTAYSVLLRPFDKSQLLSFVNQK